MQTFKGFVLSTFLLLLGIISLGEASAQFYHNDGPQYGQGQRLEAQLNRYVSGNSILPLASVLQANAQLQNLRLVKIELFAMSTDHAYASLQSGSRSIGQSQYIDWNSGEPIVFNIPAQEQLFGRDLHSLRIQISRSSYLERVVATFAPIHSGGGLETLRALPARDFYDAVSLKEVLDLNRSNNPHLGKTIKSVVLKGYPMGTQAVTVKLQIGSRTVGAPQVLNRQGTQQVRFELQPHEQAVITHHENIRLIFQGRVRVNEVTADVERVQREFRMPMNRVISGSRIFLNQFSELYGIDRNMLFERIVIRGRLAGSNSSVRACAHSSANGAFCESTNASSGHFELVLQRFPVSIEDTFVMPRGQAVIDEVILLEQKTAPHQYPF